jgi:hypothetical protein
VEALQVEREEPARKEGETSVAARRRMTFAARKEHKEREGEDSTEESDNRGRCARELGEGRRLRDGECAEGGTESRMTTGKSERCSAH